MNHIYERAKHNLNIKLFEDPIGPVDFGPINLHPGKEEIQTWRVPLKEPDTDIVIPENIKWTEPMVMKVAELQRKAGLLDGRYMYMTVRHGVNHATVSFWHTDGFPMRNMDVGSEQIYLYASAYPTEILTEGFTFPNDFDPLIHNMQPYIIKHAEGKNYTSIPAGHIVMIDPYIIHRIPEAAIGKPRTFISLTCTPQYSPSNNSYFPNILTTYNP